jgi:CHAT domain-containing protein/uncharacterized protein HemY
MKRAIKGNGGLSERLAQVLPAIFLGIALVHWPGRVQSQPIPSNIQHPSNIGPGQSLPPPDYPFFSTDIYSVLSGQDRLQMETLRSQLSLSSCNRMGREAEASSDRSSHETKLLRSLPAIAPSTMADGCNRLSLSQPVLTYDIFAPDGTRPDIAADYWKQFLAIAKRNGNRQGEMQSLESLGLSHHSLGKYSQAIEYYQQGLNLARELGDVRQEVWTLGSLGRAYTDLGNYRQAIEYHQQSLKGARSSNNKREEGTALGNLGITYHAMGDYAKAIEYHQQHLTVARAIANRQGEEVALGNLGLADHALGNYPKAIEYYQQQLTIARAISDHQGESNALGNLGNAYKALGDYAKAIDYHQQTLAIKRALDDRKGEALALGNLGNDYEALGDYSKAFEYYQQTLATAREIGDRKTEGMTLETIGIIHTNLGENTEAIRYYQQSLATAQAISDRQSEASTLGHLGFIFYVRGDYDKSLEYSQQSLTITRSIGDHRTEASVLKTLALVYEQVNDLPRAIAHHEQSIAIAKAIGYRQGEWQGLAYLGNTQFKAGNLWEAEKKLRSAIDILESLRPGLDDPQKVTIFDTQVLTYTLLQQVLIAGGKTEAALEIAERGRTRAFVELLAKRLSPTPAAKSAIAASPPTIRQIQNIAKQQNATLVEYSIVPERFLLQGKLRGVASKLFIWVIRPTGEVTFRQVDLKPLQQQKTSLKQLVLESRLFRNKSRSQAARKQLYQLLIEPVAKLLPSNPNERVIFIGQDYLFLLPFPALQTSTGKYLIEQHTLLTAPAIQVLELTRQQRQRLAAEYTEPLQGKNVLLVGNPTMPEELAPLPGAQREALAIAKILNAKALIGDRATKTDIVPQLPKARLIHLATHGLLNDINQIGIPGAIALAPSAQDDGFLTASEILDLKLNAELVVLSACNTGAGEITGDGVIGLSRSLIAAGVPSVVVSLWYVPDAATTDLMIEFYRILQENPDKAQALRGAMLTTMKQHSDPFAWAGFTLIGEAEQLH